MAVRDLRALCERAYEQYHRPEYISPDPLEVVREFADVRDREVVGLIASSIAMGRVDGIVKAVRSVVARLHADGGAPAATIVDSTPDELSKRCFGFRYRFFDADQLLGLLLGIRSVLLRYGSLERGVTAGGRSGASRDPEDLLSGLGRLVDSLVAGADGRLDRSILLSRPDRKSACKRLLLFARWMVRSDGVDPGGWDSIHPASLLYPVDTHVLKLALRLDLTRRPQASLLVSREITDAMRRISPDDPVRYDFCLTRPGIHPLLDESGFLARDMHTPAAKFDTLWEKSAFIENRQRSELMQKYVCDVCGYIYDPAEGDPDGGISPGTAFDSLPEDWVCPMCGALKEDFSPEE